MARELLEKEEKLLTRYVDGECGLIARIKAESLLKRSVAAQDFVNTSASLSKLLSADLNTSKSPDLWDRISARVEAEEKAELYLGRRFEAKSPVSIVSEYLREHLWSTGAVGALVTAGILGFAVLPSGNGGFMPAGQGMAQRNAPGIRTVSASPEVVELARSGVVPGATPLMSLVRDGRRADRPQIIEERLPSTVEVDWMKSQGRVQVLQGLGGNSPILWVKKKTPNFEGAGAGFNGPVIINRQPENLASGFADAEN